MRHFGRAGQGKPVHGRHGHAALLLALACGEAPSVEPSPSRPPVSPKALSTPEASTRRCVAPEGVSDAPQSIAEAIMLLNALPPPVDVACFVESLARPVSVFATASPFSAQPSADADNPRIFIRNGPLTMAVVPIGMGKRLLEFSELVGERRSIKGEVELPATLPLAPSAAYDRVRIGEATTCGVCHNDEAAALEGATAFASETLRPLPEFDVPPQQLALAATACADTPPGGRCDLLRALFDHGEVRPTELPAGRICHGP